MRWVIRLLVVVLCLCMAAPVLAADQGETVWSKYNMKLYGRVKVDYKYLTGRSSATSVATNIVDKLTTPDYQNDSTNFTARDTRFGYIVSHDSGDWAARAALRLACLAAKRVLPAQLVSAWAMLIWPTRIGAPASGLVRTGMPSCR